MSDIQLPGEHVRRKRGPNKKLVSNNIISQQDMELARAVCQVVKDLVCQVAEEPYGDLSRKRTPFIIVLRKFVKDAVQVVEDATAFEVLMNNLGVNRKGSKEHEEIEPPYGIDLVWGLILHEMEKIDKREKARINHAQKAARQKHKKLLETLAEIAAAYPCSEEETSDVDTPRNRPLTGPLIYDANPPVLIAVKSPSPRSEDSDWAIQPPESKSKQPRNYPIFNQRGTSTSQRGRGRPRGTRNPTVRSIIDGASTSRNQPMHPSVSLVSAGHGHVKEENLTKRPSHPMMPRISTFDKRISVNSGGRSKKVAESDPLFEFLSKMSDAPPPPTNAVARIVSSRGGRGRGQRGKGRGGKATNYEAIVNAWNEDAEEYQQHLLAQTIETTSGESQESYDDMCNTIDEVVKKVNEMSELDDVGTMKRRKTQEGEVKRPQKRGISKTRSNETPTSSRVKRMKTEGDNAPKKRVYRRRSPAPITLILDSSYEDLPTQESGVEMGDDTSSSHSVVILEEETRQNTITGRVPSV